MSPSDLKEEWVPRIGREAAAELRRYRRIGVTTAVTAIVFAIAASFAFAGGTIDKLLGTVLLVGAAGAFAMFVRGQRSLAAALSQWFGVEITRGQLPVMTLRNFDAWCERRGLVPPPEHPAAAEGTAPPNPVSRAT